VTFSSIKGTGVVCLKRCFLIFACVVLIGCERPVYEVVGGSGLSESDLTDRWLVINYWATWCGPCITEIPEFNEIHHNPRSDLIVLGVNFDGPTERSTQQADLEKMKIEFPVVIQDPAARFGYEVPSVLPTTVIVRPDGSIAAQLVGPQTKASVMQVVGAFVVSG
jgi:thiol-disulfide isomerase/thioredoxin